MKEHIDKEAVRHKIKSFVSTVIHRGHTLMVTGSDSCNPAEWTRGYEQGALDTASLIDGHPAADVVERKRGEWHWAEDGHCKCSVCGQFATVKRTVVKTNFCPNCGCDMRGEKHEAD